MKIPKIFTLVLASGLLFTSCEKMLDLQPTDSFNEANAFLTMEDIQRGTWHAYVRTGNYLNDLYASALVSDEAKLGAGNAGQGALEYRYQYGSDVTSGGDFWGAFGGYYALIDQTNRVLEKIDGVASGPSDAARKVELRGQLLAMRGFGHFGLLRSYSYTPEYEPDALGVPVSNTVNPVGYYARNTQGEVMAAIVNDLTEAKNLLPDVTAATFQDTVMNKVNVAAIQARVALHRKDYDAAVTFATEVINSNVKPLVSGPEFEGIWTDLFTNEVLLRVRYEDATNVGVIWTTLGGTIYIAPSDKLTATYSPQDVRLNAYIGYDVLGDRYLNKYYQSSRGGRAVDLKVIRTAEMYLIRAEANARKAAPDLAAAAADLNFLRTHRIDGYTDETFTSQQQLIDAIMLERYKELAFEGHRYFDLRRNSITIQRLATDASPEWQTLEPSNHRYVLPIPQAEILANPNMVQNFGY